MYSACDHSSNESFGSGTNELCRSKVFVLALNL